MNNGAHLAMGADCHASIGAAPVDCQPLPMTASGRCQREGSHRGWHGHTTRRHRRARRRPCALALGVSADAFAVVKVIQLPTAPRTYWDAMVKRMKAVFRAPIDDTDMPVIVDYLVKTYGAEQTK